MPDRNERLDFAERWITDAFRVIETPGGIVTLDVDMTRARDALARLRSDGARVTYTHLVVRAAAIALKTNPEQHVLVAGTARLHPGRVDIGLSIAGTTTYAPVMVIEDVAEKSLRVLAEEVGKRAPEVRAKEELDLASVRRWGWLIPFAWLRQLILRWLFTHVWFRRQLSGTFQVTCLTQPDLCIPLLFNTAAAVGAGRVRDRVVAVDGAPAVRPILSLACVFDHKAWDGARAANMLVAMAKWLETGELE
jgi:pyruvate dehydrogenase E2 component (dihydrolipoamide acetyltransferase)